MEILKQLIRASIPDKTLGRLREARDAFYQVRPDYESVERREFMRKSFTALSFNGISGDYLEFGSWGGMTFSLAYHESRRVKSTCKLWSFDSFRGLPPQVGPEDEHQMWIEGAMSTGLAEFKAICKRNGIPENDYVTVPGYYEDTLETQYVGDIKLPNDVAMAYIDCDLNSSTRTVLSFLSSRMKHGMILALDDYYCYSPRTLSGERLACLEFLLNDRRFHFSPFVQFGWHGMSFIVEDRAKHPSQQPEIP
ncbi:macrocin-O-methyltransferase TylF [Roseiarcus fermentans]|uniref:Macrocin-O-methyltransferase TylF n=1 Tax=Roseiarcus fermentans TaxID=1473586 RepID=A0A366EY78_9HYPH|nr:TylF/MycF/NovP-related O-methyltransferase [Roseiarcus fermentans]RBP07337.1 macrocin-O-methyltransferase TylF [Roseiarcus fermentans]